jgi:hypothetical protein
VEPCEGVNCVAANARREVQNHASRAREIDLSQRMVQLKFFSLAGLNSTWFSVLLSNPLTKDEFLFCRIGLWFWLSFFPSRRAVKAPAKLSSKQRSYAKSLSQERCGSSVAFAVHGRLPVFRVCLSSYERNLEQNPGRI